MRIAHTRDTIGITTMIEAKGRYQVFGNEKEMYTGSIARRLCRTTPELDGLGMLVKTFLMMVVYHTMS